MSETQEIKDGLTASEETEAPEDATYDHIVKYTGFLGGIQVLTILVNVVRNKLAAVLLGTAGVGLSALYQSVIGFLHNTRIWAFRSVPLRRLRNFTEETIRKKFSGR